MNSQPRKSLFIGILVMLLVGLLVSPASADEAMDYSIPNGHFFKQANGQGGGGDLGFSVVDDGDIAFWTWFQRFGGAEKVGYPVSQRFSWKGFTVQAFQKVVFQWRPESSSVALVNVFDELSEAGKDDWLMTVRSVPEASDWSSDQGKSWEQVVQNHYALLDANPAIKEVYFQESDPVTMNGLPMSAKDYGNVYVVRAQRKVFQQWKEATPWAAAGEVTVANGGDLGKEAGLYPAAAVTPGTATSSISAPAPAPAPATATPSPVGAPAVVQDRDAMAAIANKAWPIWAVVVAVDEATGEGIRSAGGDLNKVAGTIDLAVKAVEPLVPMAESLVAPDVPYAPALVAELKKGVPLYYEALKRLNWGLVSRDDAIIEVALDDLYSAYDALRQAFWEFKAGVEKQGLVYEGGEWR